MFEILARLATPSVHDGLQLERGTTLAEGLRFFQE
jgi:hypothetical protein